MQINAEEQMTLWMDTSTFRRIEVAPDIDYCKLRLKGKKAGVSNLVNRYSVIDTNDKCVIIESGKDNVIFGFHQNPLPPVCSQIPFIAWTTRSEVARQILQDYSESCEFRISTCNAEPIFGCKVRKCHYPLANSNHVFMATPSIRQWVQVINYTSIRFSLHYRRPLNDRDINEDRLRSTDSAVYTTYPLFVVDSEPMAYARLCFDDIYETCSWRNPDSIVHTQQIPTED